MDKVLSARVSESVLRRLGVLSRKLGVTKKAVIEQAIEMYADRVEHDSDPLDQTHGVWQRDEDPSETVDRARDAFRRSMDRHQR
jgi:predicted DNA-binding protein